MADFKKKKQYGQNFLRDDSLLESIPFEYQKYGFINCHASYVVNMNYIKGITDKFFIMKNESQIPISKSMSSSVKKAYINFLVGD